MISLDNRAKKIAEYIKKFDRIEIVTHQDADGLAAISIAKTALEREEKETGITVLKQLDDSFIKTMKKKEDFLYWFTDLGSGSLGHLTGFNTVITDHHEIPQQDVDLTNSERTDLLKLSQVIENQKNDIEYHLNPHLFERDGATDLSGAGATYLVAKAINKNNIDLSMLAVIGAVGDLQDLRFGKLTGTNRRIIADAKKAGVIDTKSDITFFGRETRPLSRLLMYANDPAVPGLSKNEDACMTFLRDLGIPLKEGENFRCWVGLERAERKKILSELTLILLNNGFGSKIVDRLIGEIYILPKEQLGTELHDAKEFATLLNSCGRYGAAEIGINVCQGDRGEFLKKARGLLKGHRSHLVEMLKIVKNIGITELTKIQYFHARDRISENVIGTITGMVMNSNDVDQEKPLLGFAVCDDGEHIKVSARAARSAGAKSLNLSDIMRAAALKVGGVGGGHNIAAGAKIPCGTEKMFIDITNKYLEEE